MWCLSFTLIVHTLVIVLVAGHQLLYVKEKVSLVQTAVNEGESVLVTLASQAGLDGILTKPGNLTLFGPTDDAFFELPMEIRQALEDDNQTRIAFLKYHIVNQTIHKSQLKNEATFNTLYGQPIRINFYHNNTVATASGRPIDLGRVDLNATNGVLNVLDGVMLPPTGTMADGCRQAQPLQTLTTLFIESSVIKDVSTLGPLTLFAPTNEAFAKLPKGAIDGLLKNTTALKELMYYHVVLNTYFRAGMETGSLKTLNGNSVNLTVSLDGVKVNGANVISVDETVSNGVIHMLDTVLTPP
ncbi:transforming growth factor-beta-induced protein ig-h3-like [Pecten maximus]|uniref:transforming growth factor-beta-induced protein ig-h3-like n=1 Tax=Pecten maximus TaxID=6579 RepID=UPI0014583E1F|nr:transforming growth factor-beta-induced protein ig-h3-like [Pecten maximus]